MADEGEPPHLLFLHGQSRRVDLLNAQVPFEVGALHCARDHVISVEDVIIFKLIAWRRRDQDDVRSILASGRAFDRSYVELWAEEWHVSERWQRALRLQEGSGE